MNPQIVRGLDTGRLGGGICVLVAGIVGIGATATGTLFRFKNLVLPEWLVYAASGLMLIVGAVVIKGAFQALKCSACKKSLEKGRIIFPGDGDRESHVTKATNEGNAAALASVLGTSQDWSLRLEIAYCDGCNQLANLNLLKDNSSKLVTDRVLSGPSAGPLIDLLRKHGEVEDD